MIHCRSVDSDLFIFCFGENIHSALIVSMHFSVDVDLRSCRSLLYANKNILFLNVCINVSNEMMNNFD